jgi:mono/diheme cytochrome c family protein
MIMRSAPLFVLAVLAGCLHALGPDVGPLTEPMMPTCDGDSNPAVVTTFSDVRNVFRDGGCTDCHTDNGLGIRQSGLDLDDYATLRTGGGRSGVAIVVDGDPCASILVQKIETSPPFGRRMPYDGPPFLTDAEIQVVRDWIAEGAHDN